MMTAQIPGYVNTLFVGTVALTFLLSLLTLSVLSFADSANGQSWMRRWLGWRLSGLRMSGMLQQRRIDPRSYLQSTPVALIRRQLRTCQRCPRQSQCDQVLEYRGPRHKSLAFCPNHATLDHLAAQRTETLRRV